MKSPSFVRNRSCQRWQCPIHIGTQRETRRSSNIFLLLFKFSKVTRDMEILIKLFSGCSVIRRSYFGRSTASALASDSSVTTVISWVWISTVNKVLTFPLRFSDTVVKVSSFRVICNLLQSLRLRPPTASGISPISFTAAKGYFDTSGSVTVLSQHTTMQ